MELVDTPASGVGGFTAVEVRVFSWAPFSKDPANAGFFIQSRVVHGALGALYPVCPGGGIGRHASFRCWWLYGRGSSSLLLGTMHKNPLRRVFSFLAPAILTPAAPIAPTRNNKGHPQAALVASRFTLTRRDGAVR